VSGWRPFAQKKSQSKKPTGGGVEMAEWGRKEYSKPWPSRTRVWTLVAFFATFVFFSGVFILGLRARLDSRRAAVSARLPQEPCER